MTMPLSENIRSIRVKWGYKQDDFGEIFELNRSVISTYETGIAEPKITFLVKLFELTGIPIQNLLTRKISDEEIPLRPDSFTPDETFVVNDPPGMYKRHDPAMEKHHLIGVGPPVLQGITKHRHIAGPGVRTGQKHHKRQEGFRKQSAGDR